MSDQQNRPMLIAIDPGMSGAIVYETFDSDKVATIKMPSTIRDLADELQHFKSYPDIFVWVERVGTYMPGNSGPAAVKFARHCGHIEMALTTLHIPFDYITPSKWMKAVLMTVPKEKKDRKNAIKEKMQRLYPAIKVTLWNADAMGILHWAISK